MTFAGAHVEGLRQDKPCFGHWSLWFGYCLLFVNWCLYFFNRRRNL